jgi:UDP-glucose 4-epimerase
MEKDKTCRIAGSTGLVAGALALRALDARFLFYVSDPADQRPLDELLAEAAAAAEAAPKLSHVFLLSCRSAGTRGALIEDALRYLARERGVPLAVLRAGHDAFTRPEAASRLAQAAASAAEEGRSGEVPVPPERPPVVLLTGAAGQIGRALARLLDEQGVERRGTDIVAGPAGDAAPYHRCDLADPAAQEGLAEFCRPVTHVIHLASRITNEKSVAKSYREQYRLNVAGTMSLVQALPSGLRHFAYASSMTVYGNANALAVNESHPVEPNCIYALTKLAAERLLKVWADAAGAGLCLLRYTSAYGPGPVTGRAIPNMIKRLLDGLPPQIYGDGSARRDYIYVDDLCRATVRAALREADGVLNIGTGLGTSAAELAEILVRLTGSSLTPVVAPRQQDAQAASSLVFDVAKMRKELEFTPEVTLEEGLRRTIRHIKENLKNEPPKKGAGAGA